MILIDIQIFVKYCIRNVLLSSIVACKTEINKIREKNQIHLNLNINKEINDFFKFNFIHK